MNIDQLIEVINCDSCRLVTAHAFVQVNCLVCVDTLSDVSYFVVESCVKHDYPYDAICLKCYKDAIDKRDFDKTSKIKMKEAIKDFRKRVSK